MAFGDVVQSNTGTSALATTAPTLGSGVTAGNLVVLTFAADDYNGTPNAGWNQSTGMEQQTYHGGYVWWFIASSNGQTIPSFTIGSATRSHWSLVEYAGPFDVSPYDTSNGQFQQAASQSYTTPAITPGSGSRLLVAAMNFQHSASDLGVPGTWLNSFTQVTSTVTNGANPRLAVGTAKQVVTANGSTAYSTGATLDVAQVAQSQSGLIIAFKAGAGGSNYTPSATDAVGVTDSATAAQGFARAATDAVGTTDAVGVVQAFARTATDPVGIGDSATFGLVGQSVNFPSSATGTWTPGSGFTDAGPLNLGTMFNLSSPAGIAGIRFYSPISQPADVQLWADGVKVAETTGASLTTGWNTVNFSSTYSGTTGVEYIAAVLLTGGSVQYTAANNRFTDGTVAVSVSAGPAVSNSTLNGRYTYGATIPVNSSGTTGVWYGVDAVVESVPSNLTASGTDPIGATDSLAAAQAFARSAFDTVGVTDSATFQPGFVLSFTATDSVGISDVGSQQAIDSVVDLTDLVGLTDSGSFTLSGTLTVSGTDSVGVTDSATFSRGLAFTATDGVGIADAGVTQSIDVVLDQVDPVGVTDSSSFTLTAAGSFAGSDTVGIGDSLSTARDLNRTATDPVAVTDSLSAAQDLARSATDPVGISDSGSFVLVQAGNIGATDLIGVTDSLDSAQGYARVLTDLVGATDSASFTLGMVISAPDPVGISDTATFTVEHGVVAVQATDPIPVSDALVTALDAQRSALDVVGIGDSASFRVVNDFTVTFGRPVMGDQELGNLLVLLRGERQYVHWPSWGIVGATPQIQVGSGSWVAMTLDSEFAPPDGWASKLPGDQADWWRVLLAGPDADGNPSGAILVPRTSRIRKRVTAGDEIDIIPDRGEWVRIR